MAGLLRPDRRGQSSSSCTLVSMRIALAELPAAATQVRSRAVGFTIIGIPRSSSSSGGSGRQPSRTTVGGTGNARVVASAANRALSSMDSTSAASGTAKRNPSARRVRCWETNTIDWSEQYRSTGGQACRRANRTSRSARASSCRSAGSIQSHVMTFRA